MPIKLYDLEIPEKIADRTFNEIVVGFLRYEKIKNLTNVQFLELFVTHLKEKTPFDELLDRI